MRDNSVKEPEIQFHRVNRARIKEAIVEANRSFDKRVQRHWTTYLEPVIIVVALIATCCAIVWGAMGCSSDGPGAGEDGGGTVGRDGGGTDGRAAGDGGRMDGGPVAVDGGRADGGAPPVDGSLPVVDAAMWPDGALPVSWTGVYVLTWTVLANTCVRPYTLHGLSGPGGYINPKEFSYREPETAAYWFQGPAVTAELARDLTWLYTGGKGYQSPTTWVQGPPRTITGQVVMTIPLTPLNPACSTTWGVKGVRP